MKKTFIITGLVVVATIIALIVFNKLTSKKNTPNIFAEVKKGNFEITVLATGELIPEKSIDIIGPVIGQRNNHQGNQHGGNQGGQGRGSDMHVMDLKILDMVPEGTIVKEGDYVAQLDRTSYDNTLKDELQNDSIPFVYEKNRTKQIVLLGESNEKFIIIEKGLEPGTIIYLSPPEKSESFRLDGENLVMNIK